MTYPHPMDAEDTKAGFADCPVAAEKVEHTPGPWRIAPATDYRGGEINIDSGERGQAAYICQVGMRDDPQAQADARLIVAAPDMLAALKLIGPIIGEIPSGVMGTQELTYRAFVAVENAIARATGAA